MKRYFVDVCETLLFVRFLTLSERFRMKHFLTFYVECLFDLSKTFLYRHLFNSIQ